MLICFVRIKTAIANIYANAEYIVVLFTELILPSMPKKGNPNISAGTLITRRNRNKLKFEMILADSVFINKCMRQGDKKYPQASIIVFKTHKRIVIFVVLFMLFILVK